MKKLLGRAFESPTIMTWTNLSTKILSTIIVLPLLLRRFDTAEIAMWYLFSSLMIIQTFMDLGFNDTFVRVFSFGYGGAGKTNLGDLRVISRKERETNWDTIEAIWSTVAWIYARLSVVVFVLYVVVGPLMLKKNILSLQNPKEGWIAYGVITLCSTVQFYGSRYNVYLQGVDKVALVNRWGTIASLCAILTSFAVLYIFGDLLTLVIANQIWIVINVVRNYFLARYVEDGRLKSFRLVGYDRLILQSVWPSAWRSGIGVLMTNGVVNASGLIYAQVGNVKDVASYLLGFRLIQTVVMFSLAPFYSKLPLMARLRAEGKIEEQVVIAKRGMRYAYWVYVAGFLGIGLFADPLLGIIKSNAKFVSPLLWSLMGIAFYVERFGAMHIQLYSTTNHIIWHRANGITGIIYLLLSFGLIRFIGVYSFPVALIVGHLAFYSWYSAKHSYALIGTNYFVFEKNVSIIPSLFLLGGAIAMTMWWHQ
ncbi:MAG TPA: lipopolysaccharide biosynthesis protein [Candidatus Wunengus sp. YC61]|uniref:lipopolysaccharide biosynthesis protein n=1 Tax=Candidatus Wunengus sp. YC61 TaxID=3367698 RepID=UPI0040296202